jgi:hypothetical protein
MNAWSNECDVPKRLSQPCRSTLCILARCSYCILAARKWSVRVSHARHRLFVIQRVLAVCLRSRIAAARFRITVPLGAPVRRLEGLNRVLTCAGRCYQMFHRPRESRAGPGTQIEPDFIPTTHPCWDSHHTSSSHLQSLTLTLSRRERLPLMRSHTSGLQRTQQKPRSR